jgi:hypothetical protein
MIDSFLATKGNGNTDLIIYIAKDDEKIEEYKSIVPEHNNIKYIVRDKRYLAEAWNYIIEIYSGYDFYGEVNDDHVYMTSNWDNILINAIVTKGQGWGLACPADNINDNWYKYRHPSASIISANVIKALGYFCYPEFHHYHTDKYFRDLFDSINRLFYCPEVLIEHRHWVNNKAPVDDNYRWVYSEEEKRYGNWVYDKWHISVLPKDSLILKQAIMAEGKNV